MPHFGFTIATICSLHQGFTSRVSPDMVHASLHGISYPRRSGFFLKGYRKCNHNRPCNIFVGWQLSRSLLQVDALAYGPFPSDGDSWTINAAHTSNGIVANFGPSCRLIVDWGNRQSELVYPGGQDENPLSPWYQNQITIWWHGQYYPVRDAKLAQRDPQHIIWNFSQQEFELSSGTIAA